MTYGIRFKHGTTSNWSDLYIHHIQADSGKVGLEFQVIPIKPSAQCCVLDVEQVKHLIKELETWVAMRGKDAEPNKLKWTGSLV